MSDRSEGESVPLGGLGFLLGKAHRARRRAWEAELADLGLTAPQAALLRAVTAVPGSGVRGLASVLGTDPMNVQRLAEALIAAGLCVATRDPADARRRPLYPTPEGKRRAELVAHRATATEQTLRAVLGTQDYAAVIDALQRLVAHDARPSFSSPTADSPPDSGRR